MATLKTGIWSTKLLDKFYGALSTGKCSLLCTTLIARSEAFKDLYSRGFLLNVIAEKDDATLSVRIVLLFSGRRSIDYRAPHDSDLNYIVDGIIKYFTPEKLATECLHISALPKSSNQAITRSIHGGDY